MFVALLLLCVASVCVAEDTAWEAYKTKFNKVYTAEEEAGRYETWLANVESIDSHNSEYAYGIHSYHQKVNQFSDMTDEEFKSKIGGCYKVPEAVKNGSVPRGGSPWVPLPANTPLPNDVDWRDQGYVTQVKNQGQCGSCYSFSATGALEGQWYKKTGTLPSLSEQQIVDCSGRYGNQGCGGGWYEASWKYIRDCGGNDGESNYPYYATRGWCMFDSGAVEATCTGFVDLPQGDENALTQALATIGPISVAIDASQSSFRNYGGGVYYEPWCSSSNLDHAVLAVGYGSEDGRDYYLVKNSWDTSFGEEGYIKMIRNMHNNCGIATQPSYPTV